jgi:hypothetical protein
MAEDTEAIARRIREAAESVSAPEHLRAHVAEQTARRRPRRRRLLALGGAVAVAAAAVVVALVVVLGSGGGPSIDQAVALALRPPTTDAPAIDPSHPTRLQEQVGGVWFPSYKDYAEWKPIGSRTDDLDGRRAVTVAYQGDGGPVSWTIVDGSPLHVPDGVPWQDYASFRAAILRDDGGKRVITWRKGGVTCILAGHTDDVEALLHAVGQA